MRASTLSRAVSISTGTCDPLARSCWHSSRAVDEWQHHVEDDSVVVGDRDELQNLSAIRRDVHGIGLLAQSLRQHSRRVRLVLDQQNAHGIYCAPILVRVRPTPPRTTVGLIANVWAPRPTVTARPDTMPIPAPKMTSLR